MIKFSKIAGKCLTAIFTIGCFSSVLGAPEWLSSPSNPTYAERGSDLFLNWTFSYPSSNPTWRKWYEATTSGTQIGKTIMSKYKADPVEIKRAEYQGRLEFVENGGFLLKNVSLGDEGYIHFTVDFADGTNLNHQIMLNVTILPSVVRSLPNEVIAIEDKHFTTECIFESRPIPDIKWYMKGVLLSNGPRFNITSRITGSHNNVTTVRSTLTIINVFLNDTGSIMCTAEIPFGNLSSSSDIVVHYAPKTVSFVSSKASGIAILGENVQFTCNATSIPSASYEILHNNVLVMNSTNRTFEIKSASLANEGTYKCMAYNYIGSSVVASENLTIYVRPFIVASLPRTTIAIRSRTKTVECSFKAKPTSSVKWHLNDVALVNGSKFQIHTEVEENPHNLTSVTSTVTITNVLLNDTGSLRCLAELPFGNASSMTDMIVHYAPETAIFTSNKANGVAVLGEKVLFTCNATSLPSASYEFLHNEVVIMNSTNHTFEIASVSLADEGTYRCIAYNYIGSSVVSSRNLTIHVPPALYTHSNDVTTIMENTSVSLSCAFLGEPAPEITWHKLEVGSYVIMNSTSRILVANSSFSIVESTLLFENVKRSDHARYRCRAVNQVGESEKNVTLDVTYIPVTNATFKQNYTLVEDPLKNVTWQCKLESNPVGKITWYLNGSVISSNGFHITETVLSNTSSGVVLHSELTMIGITRHKTGHLICNASNAVGSEIATTIVIVHFPPENSTLLPEQYLRVNGSGKLELECIFEANPDATVTWKYNNSNADGNSFNITEAVLSSSIYATRKRSVLRIEMVDEKLQGLYECNATNHQGSVKQQTQLVVHYSPTMLISLAPYMLKRDKESIFLHCKVQSNPLAQIEWHKDGAKISNMSNIIIVNKLVTQNLYRSVFESKLYLNALNKSDSGNYTCRAHNIIGSNSEKGRLVVQYAPEITQSFASAENLTESSTPFVLRCTVEGNPRPVVKWYHNGQISEGNITETIVEETDAKTLLQSTLTFYHGIKRDNNGTYSCNATNSVGSAMKTVVINVWYAPDMLSHLNGTKNLVKMSNVTFECRAEGHPAPTLNWYKSGRKLSNVPIKSTSLSGTKTLVESKVILAEVTKNDTGDYKCEVENLAGRKEQAVMLNVLFEPVLPVLPPNITANQSERVELNCHADANPPVTRYNWTKDGNVLSETGPSYVIPSAQEASAGIYTCNPVYSLGISGSITYNLHVQVPAHITKTITCTRSNSILYCSCQGHGIPKPLISWTKDNSTVVLATGDTFNLTVQRGKDGRYHCNAVNKLAAARDTYNVFFFDKPVGQWSIWGSCNASCGSGYQQRTRQCNFKPCPEHLIESLSCNGTCITTPNVTATTQAFIKPSAQKKENDAWSIVIYVLIPVLAVMAIVLIVWLANVRGCRREEKEFIVPLNNSLSQPPSIRSMPTRRGIFLPDNNFGVLNSGYRPDGNDAFPNFDATKYDTVEVEMEFANDVEETNTEETPRGEPGNGTVEGGEEEALSFYNSAYTHL